ncbi:hypothetical protein [Wenjunlia tyrosinilytica]|uniref:Uncharacterized protein n=1 Tax=Wenjunlia tyrosinilytica TaxID=1544741 RepID=A0A917ZXH0_9ACTN|nr:hypothetical protein [Wenjunlia tyrosinilytica]GGP00332.1 hypothetical protein GCM10012280_68860 [Wenjunlia tyrosinilytica]
MNHEQQHSGTRGERITLSAAEKAEGFAAVMERLKARSPQEKARLRQRVEAAELGHQAYALGHEYLESGDHQAARRWLQVAADHDVPGAEQALHDLDLRQTLDRLTDTAPTGSQGPTQNTGLRTVIPAHPATCPIEGPIRAGQPWPPLDEAMRAANRITADARAAATRITDQAQHAAREIITEAHERAQETAREIIGEAHRQARAIADDAHAEAEQIGLMDQQGAADADVARSEEVHSKDRPSTISAAQWKRWIRLNLNSQARQIHDETEPQNADAADTARSNFDWFIVDPDSAISFIMCKTVTGREQRTGLSLEQGAEPVPPAERLVLATDGMVEQPTSGEWDVCHLLAQGSHRVLLSVGRGDVEPCAIATTPLLGSTEPPKVWARVLALRELTRRLHQGGDGAR